MGVLGWPPVHRADEGLRGHQSGYRAHVCVLEMSTIPQLAHCDFPGAWKVG